MKLTLKAAAALTLAVPFSATLLRAQTTGVSHPEDIPITTSPEGIAQPVVYTPTPEAREPGPVLKVRAAEAPSEVIVVPARPALTAAVPARTERAEEFSAGESDRPGRSTQEQAGVITRVAGPGNELPVGTMLTVRLNKGMTTRTTASGTEFEGAVADAVTRDGRVLIPAGSVVSGLVTEVHGGTRISGGAVLHLRPESVTLPDGIRYALSAQVIDTDQYGTTKVDEEGTIRRRDQGLKTVAVFALAAGSGAAAGALIAGWPGALVGAGVGIGVSTVVWLKQDRQAEVPGGTKLVFQLTKPMVFGER